MRLRALLAHPRTWKIQLAAAIAGVQLELAPHGHASDDTAAGIVSKGSSAGQPVLETEQGSLFGADAILRYLARLCPGSSLYGEDNFAAAIVDQWLDFAAGELEPPVAVWLYPIFGFVAFDPAAHAVCKSELARCLKILDAHLQNSGHMVGHSLTLADISIWCSLKQLFEMVLDPPMRAAYPNVTRWFTLIASLPAVVQLLGVIELAHRETIAQSAGVSSSATEGKAAAAKGGKGKREGVAKKKAAKVSRIEQAAQGLDGTASDEQQQQKKKKELSFMVERKEFVDDTAPGQLKDFSKPMEKAYHPQLVEAAWDAYWEAQGFYKANPLSEKKETFSIVIPPPNVTGTLHIGHALMVAIEDAVVRWHRMLGKEVLWVPGSDHAGIATQAVVERKLQRTRGLSRHDLGRERFLEEVWKWKEANGNRIFHQLRRMGASVDWSRAVFTMDEPRSRAVTEAFVRMFDMGLIYRDNRLVHWSCALCTAISNIEVEHEDIAERCLLHVPGYDKPVEFGVLHKFAYPIADSSSGEEIVVGTTRLETMLGDVAVAVHPDDPRYKKFHGRFCRHPFIPGRRIQVIADSVLVDPEFGTGAVKITPAHDPDDFECGVRHGLERINVFTDRGDINENGGEFQGMKRFDARVRVLERLQQLGLYRGWENNAMRIGRCSRSSDIIEPVLRPQWWVNTKEMSARSLKAVETGELEMIPPMFKKKWYEFLNDPEDWCISRQLWWGHRIPTYRVLINGKRPERGPQGKDAHVDSERDVWVCRSTTEQAMQVARAAFPDVPPERITIEQDPDVLDTWFSSGLFPFSVFDWPNDTADLRRFFPGALLETGHDILFFWVARMVMMSLTLCGVLPFKQVVLHGIVRDKNGDKMSKGKGNIIDPIDVINGITLDGLQESIKSGNLPERDLPKALALQKRYYPDGIPECGADALRFALLAFTQGQGPSINLDPDRILGYRQFCNKIWNAAKFALMTFPADFKRPELASMLKPGGGSRNFVDNWILHQLHETIRAVNTGMQIYDFAMATNALYDFWWHQLCDVYLECIKPITRRTPENSDDPAFESRCRDALNVLFACFHYGLRALHPFMPFLTEELFHRLPGALDEADPRRTSIMVQPFPRTEETQIWCNPQVNEDMMLLQEIAKASRSQRSQLNVPKSQRAPVYLACADERTASIVKRHNADAVIMAHASEIHVVAKEDPLPKGCIPTVVNAQCTLHALITGVSFAQEASKQEKALDDKQTELDKLVSTTSNPAWAKSTPPQIQESIRARMESLRGEISQLRESLQFYHDHMGEDDKRKLDQLRIERQESALKNAQKRIEKELEKIRKKVKDPSTIDAKTAKEIEAKEKEIADIDAAIQRLRGSSAS